MPSIARIERDTVTTADTWRARACFLVWAQVPGWAARTPRYALADLDAIEREAVALARKTGLDPDRPFPFRIEGLATTVGLHVLDKRDGLPHDPERHEQAKVRRMLELAPGARLAVPAAGWSQGDLEPGRRRHACD